MADAPAEVCTGTTGSRTWTGAVGATLLQPVEASGRPAYSTDRRPTIGAKKKTTFAKMNREAKLREKRHAKAQRTEQRKREAAENGGEVSHEVEDLSHLDVAHVEGVLPDVTVKP